MMAYVHECPQKFDFGSKKVEQHALFITHIELNNTWHVASISINMSAT